MPSKRRLIFFKNRIGFRLNISLQLVLAGIMNRESYNEISKEWQKIRDNAHINTPIKEFSAYLPANAHVLDIGCGTGKPIGSYFATYDFEITGIDFAEKMIQIAQNQDIPNAQYFLADITNFETTERFDGIIAWD